MKKCSIIFYFLLLIIQNSEAQTIYLDPDFNQGMGATDIVLTSVIQTNQKVLNIANDNDEEIIFSIVNISGKIVQNGSFVNRISLNIESLPSGLYVVEISSSCNHESISCINE